jgi:hypothetical protein
LALAAVAGDSWFYLSLGLLLSVSLVMFGSVLVVELLDRVPSLTRLGAALLGWVAGQMAVSDALLQDWIAQQAPALPLLVPALAAIYAYSVGHTAPPAVRRTAIAPPRPAPLPRPKPAPSLAIDPPDAPAHSAAQDRRLLIVFVALFVVVGVFLAFLAMRAGGPAG